MRVSGPQLFPASVSDSEMSSSVISLLLALVIVALLLCHYLRLVWGRKQQSISENQVRVRIAGRHFMLQTTLFVLTIGLLALFMSRVVSGSVTDTLKLK